MKSFTFGLLAVAVAASAAGDNVTLTLAASPTQLLPGTPAAFIVTMKNSTALPVTVMNSIRLLGSRGGNVFVATTAPGRDVATLPADQTAKSDDMRCITIDPGSTRQLYLDFGQALVENEFFFDPQLSQSGAVDVQLEFLIDTEGSAATVMTNSVTLTIMTPSGADLQVWRHMQELAGKPNWTTAEWITYGAQLEQWTASNYPASMYNAWMPAYAAANDPIPAYDAALALDPPAALRDMLLYGKALKLDRESRDALIGARNEDNALALADAARNAVNALLKVTTTDTVRSRAQALSTAILTRKTADEIMKTLLQEAPPAPQPVRPHVDCVSPGSQRLVRISGDVALVG